MGEANEGVPKDENKNDKSEIERWRVVPKYFEHEDTFRKSVSDYHVYSNRPLQTCQT